MRMSYQTLKNRVTLTRVLVGCLLVIGYSLIAAGWVGAQVLFEEDFENVLLNATGLFVSNGWDGPAFPASMYIVDGASKPFQGAKALELKYNPGSTGSTYMHKPFTGQDSLYHRWYQKWSGNWVWDTVSTKMVIYGPNQGYPQFYPEVLWGDGRLAVQVQGADQWTGGNKYQNVGNGVVFQPDRWYCIEVFVKLNTPGQADGQLKAWIDGIEVMSHLNQQWRGPGVKLERVTVSGYYNGGVPQLQFSWHDAHVLSTQRVGCQPNVPDRTPPRPPGGLRVTGQ